MATKLAQRIVSSNSPIEMTEAFVLAMKERTGSICEGVRKEFASTILLENPEDTDYDKKLDSAVDYTLRSITKNGLASITESIEKASTIFKVEKGDLEHMFESSIAPETSEEIDAPIRGGIFEDFEINFLSGLDNILENNSGNILMFKDSTSEYVTPEEGEKLLELYSNLNEDHKKQMVERLVSSKKEYKKLVEFAGTATGE